MYSCFVFALPLQTVPEYFQSDVPAGIQKRQSDHGDIPGLQYTAAVNGKEAVAIITDCKYGYRGIENRLYATLINSSANPDPYPELGEHVIKLWITVNESDPKILHDQAFSLCHPVSIVSGTPHSGSLAPAKELVHLDSASTVLSSCGITNAGDLLIRVYETAGKNDDVDITVPFEVKKACLVDLNGENLTDNKSLSVKSNKICFKIPPFRIHGLKVGF